MCRHYNRTELQHFNFHIHFKYCSSQCHHPLKAFAQILYPFLLFFWLFLFLFFFNFFLNFFIFLFFLSIIFKFRWTSFTKIQSQFLSILNGNRRFLCLFPVPSFFFPLRPLLFIFFILSLSLLITFRFDSLLFRVP